MADLDSELKDALSESEANAEELPSGVVPPPPPAESPKKNLGLLVGLLVVAGAILTLVFTSVDEAAIYSVTTDQLLAEAEKYDGKTVRVEGELVKGSLRHRAEPCEYRFVIEKNGQKLPVRYPQCVVPDTFKDVPDMDVQVTAEGELTEDGHFAASHIMAKCPSKYEMQQKAKRGEEAPHSAMGGPGELPPIVD